MVLALLSVFWVLPGAANAAAFTAYDGFWSTTDGDGQTVSVDLIMSLAFTEFGVFYDDESVAVLKNNDFSSKFTVSSDGNTLTSKYGSIGLDGTNTFQFYFVYDGVRYETYDIFTDDIDTNVYLLSLNNIEVLSIDSRPFLPVPIPPSALLLGSGVIGLLGVGVRRRKNS